MYTLKVANKTPVFQNFVVDDPIPTNTKFFWGWFFDSHNQRIHWAGKLAPHQTQIIHFWVRIDPNAGLGTVITNTATLTDGAVGDTATVTTTVVHPREAGADDYTGGGSRSTCR